VVRLLPLCFEPAVFLPRMDGAAAAPPAHSREMLALLANFLTTHGTATSPPMLTHSLHSILVHAAAAVQDMRGSHDTDSSALALAAVQVQRVLGAAACHALADDTLLRQPAFAWAPAAMHLLLAARELQPTLVARQRQREAQAMLADKRGSGSVRTSAALDACTSLS